MLSQRIVLISLLSVLVVGCAGKGSQPPAPVYDKQAGLYGDVIPYPDIPDAPVPPEAAQTSPLKESGEVPVNPENSPSEQPEALLTPEQEQELSTLQNNQGLVTPPAPTEALPPLEEPSVPPTENQIPPLEPDLSKPETGPETGIPPLVGQTDPANPELPAAGTEDPFANPLTTDPALAPVEPPPPPPPPPEPPFEPLTSFAPLSPVANALVIAANQNTQKGDIQSATTTIERAIRIEPRNATLYYQLAVLRLKESKPTLAEDLAKKCLLLASNDTRLKKHSWLLIAEAREMQKDFDGSKEAKDKADGF
jgi:hypothetical protein